MDFVTKNKSALQLTKNVNFFVLLNSNFKINK